MLRPNGDSGKIRKGNFVLLSHRSVDAKKTRCCKGYVLGVSARSTRPILPSGQVQSDFKDLRSRRRVSAATVLDAFSQNHSVYDSPSSSNGTSANCGSGRDDSLLDWEKTAGAGWEITPYSLGATGVMVRTQVRVTRIGTTLPRTRTTTSGRAASVATSLYCSVNATALQADHSKCGQPVLSSFGKYSAGSGRSLSSLSKGAASFFMKRHKNLIDQITSIENLRLAYRNTAKAKRMTWGYLQFKEYDELNLLRVQEELKAGAYQIGEYRTFIVKEPKPRLISALNFKDRLVQHALCNVIAPIFERGLMPYTFACRVGMGTHAGVKHIQARLRSTEAKYFLKTDYSKFFPSVDHPVLHEMIDRKIGCEKTLQIIREIVPLEGKGIPIGSLTSQLFANVYGNAVDRFIHFELGHRHWARYMDDIVSLGDDMNKLRSDFYRIQEFSQEKLKLNISKWQVSPVNKGINFLGYRVWPEFKLIRKDSVVRAKRKIDRYIKNNNELKLEKFLGSWRGHTQWADTNNLFNWLEKKHGNTY